jgi:hypothetical protein
MRKLVKKIKRDMPELADQISKKEVYAYAPNGNKKELNSEQLERIRELIATFQKYNHNIYVFGVIEETQINYLGDETKTEYYLYIPDDDFEMDRFRGKTYSVPAYAINTATKLFGYMDVLVREDKGILRRD